MFLYHDTLVFGKSRDRSGRRLPGDCRRGVAEPILRAIGSRPWVLNRYDLLISFVPTAWRTSRAAPGCRIRRLASDSNPGLRQPSGKRRNVRLLLKSPRGTGVSSFGQTEVLRTRIQRLPTAGSFLNYNQCYKNV